MQITRCFRVLNQELKVQTAETEFNWKVFVPQTFADLFIIHELQVFTSTLTTCLSWWISSNDILWIFYTMLVWLDRTLTVDYESSFCTVVGSLVMKGSIKWNGVCVGFVTVLSVTFMVLPIYLTLGFNFEICPLRNRKCKFPPVAHIPC